jgi:folate-binding protein YgfZ
MSETGAAFLTDRGIVRVSGEDATEFLQKLLTNDVSKLQDGEARFAALLSPQGKLLFDFIVVREPAEAPSYLIDVSRAQTGDLIKRLTLYRLRLKVAIEDLSASFGVAVAWGGAAPHLRIAFRDPRKEELGYRVISLASELRKLVESAGDAGEAAYDAHRIAVAVPKGGVDFVYGDSYPHDANMDWINGVDFKKGCYVGQEIVARMQYRNAARKRILPVQFGGAAPEAGTAILAGETEIGKLGASAEGRGLALVRTDKAEEAKAAGLSFTAGGQPVRLGAD